jgi:putative transposase
VCGNGDFGNTPFDFNRHIDYIHINPVKHGYVQRAADWQFSSFHRTVKLGILPADWAGVANDELDLE